MVFLLTLALVLPLLGHIRHLFDAMIANESCKPAYEGRAVFFGILRQLYASIESIVKIHSCTIRNDLPHRMNRPTSNQRYTPYGRNYNNGYYNKYKYRY
jgi:hypothetical protein